MIIENLLEKIFLSKHPLSEYLNINPDLKSFVNYEGKTKNVYFEQSNKKNIEEIAREILMQTYLKEEQHLYSSENYHEDNYRSDLIGKPSKTAKNITSIIEVKQGHDLDDKKITVLVKNSFDKVLTCYTPRLEEDCFISIFIMDVEKIISDIDCLSKYFNLDLQARKNISSYKKYGIYIETKRFDSLNKIISNNSWFNLPKHGNFFISSKNSPLKINKTYCYIKDAINLPTNSSSAYGIKNVRDIKDPTILMEKRDLIKSILKTSLESFQKQNPDIITYAGKGKDFLTSLDETIFYEISHGNGKDEYRELILCTLNGAIIDGQNSIDSYKRIIEAISKKTNRISLDKFEEKILSLLKDKENNSDNIVENAFNKIKLDAFKTWLEETPLVVNIEFTDNTESARKIATSKNNTMQVTPSELSISEIQSKVQFLANELLEYADINLIYPKKQMFVISKKLQSKSIDIDTFIKHLFVYHAFHEEKKKKKKTNDILSLFSLSQTLGNTIRSEFYKKIDFYVKTKIEQSPKIIEITSEITSKRKNIEQIESFINDLKINNFDDSIQYLIDKRESEIEEISQEIFLEQEKIENIAETNFILKNRDDLVFLINLIFVMKKTVSNYYESLSENNLTTLKTLISNEEKFKNYIFIMYLTKYENAILEKHKDKVIQNNISDLCQQLFNNIDYIIKTYVVDMTTLRNSSDNLNTIAKHDGTTSTLGDARNDFFKIQ